MRTHQILDEVREEKMDDNNKEAFAWLQQHISKAK